MKISRTIFFLTALAATQLAHAGVLYSLAGPQLVNETWNFAPPGLSLSRGANATGTLYFKYSITSPASNITNENYYAGMSFFDGANEHLGIGNGWGAWAYSAFNTATGDTDLKSTTPEPGQPYQLVRATDTTTIVIRVDFNSGANDNVTVWFNPNFALSEAAQNPALATTFTANADFDTIYLREGGGGAGWEFSNFVIAENATDLGFFAVPGPPVPGNFVGDETFDYPDGSIAGRDGGTHWDYDNSTENDPAFGHTGTPSDWDVVFGTPTLTGGVLITQDSGAIREYKGTGEGAQAGSDERFGALSNDGMFQKHVVYYKFDMTRRAGATWGGASSYDFTAEKYLFGVPTAPNPASGNREFAIHDLGGGQWAYSGIQPVDGQTYTLVAKLDFSNDIAALYLNPNLSQPESLNTPVAVYPHSSENWSSAIRFGSGGSGQTEWDNLRVAHEWNGLTDGPPLATDDSATMPHLAEARLQVLANDSGSLSPPSITILTPPSYGTAATTVADGSVLYKHSTGTPATDSFTYRITNADDTLNDTATVTITFATSTRYDTNFVVMPTTPPLAQLRIEDAFPGITFDSPHGFSTIPGNMEKLFVTEGDGRVYVIPNISSPEKILILDHTAAVQHDDNELAMKGIAAHPQWATNGYIYLTYNSNVGSVRLSRFTCQTTPPYTVSSELVLIEQNSDDTVHNIGSCKFGPDGYLYVGFGDEGTQGDGYNNAQHVDRNFWSSVIRIDVDKKPGSLPPNPNPGVDPYAGAEPAGQSNDTDLIIPRVGGGSSGEAHYAIPPDNPLVGATTFNGITLDPSQVRTEIAVMGVRNPWQFSPEDNDLNGTVDEIWVADVGRSDREEINRFPLGSNGGWSWREGSIAGPRSGQMLNGALQSAATLTEPLWDYTHGGGPFQGSSVTGGFIYRGASLPGFTGKYVFADYMSGNIWTLDSSGAAPVIERVAGEVAIVALLADPVTGDILLLDRGNIGAAQGAGSIKRLTFRAADGTLPSTLAATNFFADLTDLTPNPGAHFYEPNLRFWSDFGEKKRWFLVPDSHATIGYAQDAPWTYPSGMIWVKHFDYPTQWESFPRTIDGQLHTDRRPTAGSPRRRLETRFLIRNNSGSYGISYRWENINSGSQNDATLVGDSGEAFDIPITLDGNPTTVPWQIPSRTNCMTCHTPEAGHALSFNTRQLNTIGTVAGISGNLINLLGLSGYLNGGPTSTAGLPRHFRPDETNISLESRVRSYLDVNCAYCHQAGGTGGGYWDGRAHLSLAQTKLIKGLTVDAPLQLGDQLVVPAHPAKSILFNRTAAANGYSRMPPLATSVVDLEGAQLIADWIAQEVEPHLSYNEWRAAKFGNTTTPPGSPVANPDADKFDNTGEWAFGTHPLTHGDTESITSLLLVHPAAGIFRFSHPRLKGFRTAGIRYRYEVSDDLSSWAEVTPIEQSAAPIAGNLDYQIVTLRLPEDALSGRHRLFLRILSHAP